MPLAQKWTGFNKNYFNNSIYCGFLMYFKLFKRPQWIRTNIIFILLISEGFGFNYLILNDEQEIIATILLIVGFLTIFFQMLTLITDPGVIPKIVIAFKDFN
jgi:hypothetical protein